MSGDQRTVIKGNPSQYVKLNVGGCLYYTTIGTLTKAPDTMLQAMFSGRMEVLTDPEGWILIDRCGKHFGTILNYLRDGNVGLPTNSQELEEILAEAKFYCITGLINLCEKTLENRNTVLSPVCQVPFITSEDERKQFIANATKPVVELLINRHNNKYSYTNTSDENLLKNLEMFDRLALRFNGRIHFIKDAIGPSEICCWRFYGNGKKFAEVCCTSIVYATDRKHTKVEFPEARIYEETLNSFLYENRPGPDQELMRATSVGGVVVGVGGVTNCTSDEEEDRRHHRSSNMPKSAMTVEACVSSKTGSSETINTVSTANSTPGSSLTQPLQIFPQHELSPNVTNMSTSTPIASKLSGPGSLDTLARDLYKVFASTPKSRKSSLATSPQPSTSKQGSNLPVTTPLTQPNVKPCVVSPQSSLIPNQPLAAPYPTLPVLSPVLPVTSPRMPVGSPTPPVSSPALPVSSPTLPVSSPTMPVPSQTWLFPCQGSLLPGQASPLPSQASPLPSQASPLPSQASPFPGQASQFPRQASLVQSQASTLPSQVSPFPGQASPLPRQASLVQSQASTLPSQVSPFPSQTSSFPRQASLVQSHASPVPGLSRMPMQASPVIFQKSVVPSQVTPVSSLGNPVSSQLGTPIRMSPLPSHISPVPTQAPRPALQMSPTPSNILQTQSNLQSHGLHLPPHFLTATSQRLPVPSQPPQYQRYIVPTPQGYSVIDCSPTGMIPQSNASLASMTASPKLL